MWSKLKSAAKSTGKALKSTAKAVSAKAVSTAAKVTKTVAKTVSKVSTTVAKASSTVSKVATKVATNSNSKIVKSIAGSVAKTADKVTTVANKVTATADKVAELSDQIAKTYDKIAEDAWADAKENFASAAKDFNAAAKEAKEQLQCVAEKAGDVIVSAATTAWDYCKQNPMEIVHGALDVIGMLPGVGNIADGINAAIYLAEGDYVNAALSAVSLIPFGGALAALGKVASKSDNLVKMAVKHGDEVAEGIAKYGDEVVEGIAKKSDEFAEAGQEIVEDVRHRIGEPVPATEKTLDMALDPEGYAYVIADKYGINLRGSGQEITIKYNPALNSGTFGKTRASNPTVIEIGHDAIMSEEQLANTIAHELNHARDFLRGGKALEDPAYAAGDALADYIRGGR